MDPPCSREEMRKRKGKGFAETMEEKVFDVLHRDEVMRKKRILIFCQIEEEGTAGQRQDSCLLYTSPSPRDRTRSRMPSSA